MKFEEILPALREGKKIRRAFWWEGHYIKLVRDGIIDQNEISLTFGKEDLMGEDWEIVKEPKKVKLRDLTQEQYEKWFNNNCCSKNEDKRMSDCFDCIFHNVICNPEISRCWIKHKDLYSDKFLDQEIEIEE